MDPLEAQARAIIGAVLIVRGAVEIHQLLTTDEPHEAH